MLKWLEEWYSSYCNGDWEHCFGVKFHYITNQGWSIIIDLSETNLEDLLLEKQEVRNSEEDWVIYLIDNRRFLGYGDSTKLRQLLQIFKDLYDANRCDSDI